MAKNCEQTITSDPILAFLKGHSVVPKYREGANKRAGLFGYYTKNYFLFNTQDWNTLKRNSRKRQFRVPNLVPFLISQILFCEI